MTIVLNTGIEKNLVGYLGAELSDQGCISVEYLAESVITCQYLLKARGNNFGILFQGGFTPIFYTVEWVRSAAYVPSFSWW